MIKRHLTQGDRDCLGIHFPIQVGDLRYGSVYIYTGPYKGPYIYIRSVYGSVWFSYWRRRSHHRPQDALENGVDTGLDASETTHTAQIRIRI